MSATSVVRRPGRVPSREETRPGPGSETTARRTRRWRITVIAIAAVALTWAFAPFVLVALDAAAHHRVFLGVAGYYPMDGLQYLAWVRDAHDGVIRNLYGSLGVRIARPCRVRAPDVLADRPGSGRDRCRSAGDHGFLECGCDARPGGRLRARGGKLAPARARRPPGDLR